MPQWTEVAYDRAAAVSYATEWAYRRNPNYYDFSKIGGDCTNFASQCIFAGSGIMNHTPTFGWYYYSLQNRAPAWTSVRYLYQFLTTNSGQGPYASEVGVSAVEPGDLVQIRFQGSEEFNHTPVIQRIDGEAAIPHILVAAHSFDASFRPLSSYRNVAEFRFLHIQQVRKPNRQ